MNVLLNKTYGRLLEPLQYVFVKTYAIVVNDWLFYIYLPAFTDIIKNISQKQCQNYENPEGAKFWALPT